MPTQSLTWPKAIPGWLNATLVCGTFATLLWLEHRRPLRRQMESKLTRNMRNLAMVGLSATTIWLIERPVASALAQFVEREQWGLVQYLRLPTWLKVVLSVLLLDYTLYLWHVLTHKVPVLWRFHRVHHADLDLDASTALRFHCLEMMLSVPWRAAQVLAIGVAPLTLSIWQTATLLAVSLHRDAAYAWHSPFHDSRGNQCQLVNHFRLSRLSAPDAQAQCPAASGDHRGAGVPRPAGSHVREDHGDAVWQAAPHLAAPWGRQPRARRTLWGTSPPRWVRSAAYGYPACVCWRPTLPSHSDRR